MGLALRRWRSALLAGVAGAAGVGITVVAAEGHGALVAIGALLGGAAGVGLVALRRSQTMLWRLARGVEEANQRLKRLEHRTAGERREVRQRGWDFRQVEALLGLYHLLPFRQALPPARGWAASPDFLLAAVGLILDRRPGVVVECGSGLSTVVLGYALQRAGAGRLLALEHDEAYAGRTRQMLASHGLEDVVQVTLAPLEPFIVDGEAVPWYRRDALADVRRCDLLVVDGPPQDVHPLVRYPALPVLAERLSAGAVVLADDCRRDEERAVVDRWLVEQPGLRYRFLEHEKGTGMFTVARG